MWFSFVVTITGYTLKLKMGYYCSSPSTTQINLFPRQIHISIQLSHPLCCFHYTSTLFVHFHDWRTWVTRLINAVVFANHGRLLLWRGQGCLLENHNFKYFFLFVLIFLCFCLCLLLSCNSKSQRIFLSHNDYRMY